MAFRPVKTPFVALMAAESGELVDDERTFMMILRRVTATNPK